MPRFRTKRDHPRLRGTKKKHGHDSLHLVETARVKVNKARVRLPKKMKHKDALAVLVQIKALRDDLDTLTSKVLIATRGETEVDSSGPTP